MISALRDCGAEVLVLYMDSPDLCDHRDHSALWSKASENSFAVGHVAKSRRVTAAFLGLQYQTAAWARWIGDVVSSCLELNRRQPFDLIYSRSPTLCGHLAGYWLARRLKLPWIANLNDPWDWHLFPGRAPQHVSAGYATISNFWLRRTLRTANIVTYPCNRLAAYMGRLSGVDRKNEIIPHVGAASSDNVIQDEFRLVHAGKLGSNEITGRSTIALLKALRSFLDKTPAAVPITRFVLVGKEDPQTNAIVAELGLKAIVVNAGEVSYEESLKHMALASVCILIEGKMEEGVYLPSKVADYLTARKPVLALSPAKGTIADMVSSGGVIRVDQQDEQEIEKAISRLYTAYIQGLLLNFAPSDRVVDQFSAKVISNQFLQLVSQLTPNTKAAGHAAKVGYGLPETELAAR
jgi:glycosyltransferase involved in cell wall biosynthesis